MHHLNSGVGLASKLGGAVYRIQVRKLGMHIQKYRVAVHVTPPALVHVADVTTIVSTIALVAFNLLCLKIIAIDCKRLMAFWSLLGKHL
jgi:hypothetical protein